MKLSGVVRRFVSASALLAGTAVIGGMGAPNALAQSAAQTWEVQVGGGANLPPGVPPLFEAQAFGPSPLVIHAGDTVTWKFAGVHTVTFNSGKPDLPFVIPGPGAGELTFGPAAFPTGITNGAANYDGSQQVSSGAPLEGPPEQVRFALTFTKPGLYGYICMLHPGMRADVDVQEAGAPLPETPAQAKVRGQVTLAALTDKARTDMAGVRPVDVGTVHVALAGLADGFGGTALQFIHGDRTINRGDTMVWTNADPTEIHTITFPGAQTPPDLVQPRPQPNGPPALVIPANVAGPAGGDSYSGPSYANSGLLAAGGSYALRFDAPAGSYAYLCLIHPWMRGTITVAG